MYHEYNWKLWAYGCGIGVKIHDLSKDDALAHINSIKDQDGEDSYPGTTNRKWSHR